MMANLNYSVDLDFTLNTPEYNECIIEAPIQISGNSNSKSEGSFLMK